MALRSTRTLGWLSAKRIEDARHEGAGIVVGCGDPHLARQRRLVEHGERLLVCPEDAPGVRHQELAIDGQPGLPALPGEELAAELHLELADLHGDGGLRAVHPLAGGGEAAGLGDGHQAPEIVEIEHEPIHERF
jgi:hypothetical protein